VIELFYGFDPREEVGAHTFVSSVLHNTKAVVRFTPLRGEQKDGTNAFTYIRFDIPRLMGYRGFAIFADGSDMVCRGDIAELWAMRDPLCAVQVVQHDYKTKHPRKYVGTPMEAPNEDYPRKNWSSLMLINCGHYAWRHQDDKPHRLGFLGDRIGALPMEWNWLVDEYGENDTSKILHWTAGIPAWEHYATAPMSDEWVKAHAKVNHAA
jgi:lipopolysaccharide biosynthesis glycosyltransferase